MHGECLEPLPPEQDRLPQNPCVPSPCGPNSICLPKDSIPTCSCLPNYIGRPPCCRPECTINAECFGNLACVNERCIDPCPGSCGINAFCKVISHNPVCKCNDGYTGDPFIACRPTPISRKDYYLSIIMHLVSVFIKILSHLRCR
jgi:hypothetical protein